MAYKSIDEYFASVTPEAKRDLEKLRKQIHKLLPDATEVISYGMPAFKLNGHVMLGFAAFKNHYSLLPFSGSVVERFPAELSHYQVTKGTIHFDYGQAVPDKIVRLVIETRKAETQEKDEIRKLRASRI
jgi:uncharacterized protein YdhG (YjbR/CyaY superfamily)